MFEHEIILIDGKPQTKCKNADKYKGEIEPTCGCDVCKNRHELCKLYKAMGIQNISF